MGIMKMISLNEIETRFYFGAKGLSDSALKFLLDNNIDAYNLAVDIFIKVNRDAKNATQGQLAFYGKIRQALEIGVQENA